MPLTIYDISKKANVSIATVSRVLNGSDSVKESTKKKILDIIEEYEYTPNASARAMSLRSLRTIGILCADSSDVFLAKAVYLLQQGPDVFRRVELHFEFLLLFHGLSLGYYLLFQFVVLRLVLFERFTKFVHAYARRFP